jgi:hypothetical protein
VSPRAKYRRVRRGLTSHVRVLWAGGAACRPRSIQSYSRPALPPAPPRHLGCCAGGRVLAAKLSMASQSAFRRAWGTPASRASKASSSSRCPSGHREKHSHHAASPTSGTINHGNWAPQLPVNAAAIDLLLGATAALVNPFSSAATRDRPRWLSECLALSLDFRYSL